MSNTLTKEVNQLWRPGTSGVPGNPGQPAREAYTSYEPVYSCRYEWPYGTRRVQDDSGEWVEVPIIPEGVQSVQQVYVCATRVEPVFHPAQPYVPPTPGVAATASQLLTDYNLGWTGGARSVRFLEGDGRISWKVSPHVTGVVVGLNDADLTTEYVECEHAIYCARGIFRVYENGAMRPATGGYVTDDVFTIRRRQGVVTYWKNTTLIYTSSAPSTGTVFMDASLYTGGDEVLEPALVGESGGTVSLQPIAVMGSNKTYAAGDIVLQPLEVIHSQASRGAVELQPLEVLGADRPYGEGAVVLAPLEVYGTAGMAAPSWGIGDVALVPLTVSGLILTGEIGTGDVALQPLEVLGADRPYGEGRITLPTLSVYAHAYEIPDEATLNSSALVSGLLTDTIEIAILLSSNGVITSAFTTAEWLDVALQSAAAAASSLTSDETIELLLYSAATGTTPRPGDEADKQVWVVNIETGASTRYADYDFNSYAKIGQRYFGCKADGIYQLDGDTDAGAPIRAMVSFGKQDFGTSMLKRITNAYVGVSGQGRLFLKVLAEGQEYTYAQRGYDAVLQTQRFDTGKGLRVNWLEFELYNADGEDFELASVEFAIVPLSRRI